MSQEDNEHMSRKAGRSKSLQSKYDYIKIKVWLGTDKNHYYILSRYILSRTLTCAKIPQDSAIKIALRLKKWLVDSTIFDLHQDELEQHIFRCIQEEGFTDVEISRFKLVNRFKQSRNPLVIFMCGLPSDTKTLIAQELSHTMHVPNVLRTDDIEEILRLHPSVCMDTHRSILDTSLDGASARIEEYKKECQIIHKAMQHDVLKAFKDGKSIIIEGFHLDPEYIVEQCVFEQGYDITLFRGGVDDTSTKHSALVIPILIHMDQDQYSIDAQPWIGISTGSTVDPQCLVERVHSTIGEYLQHACTSHAIPAIQVDMVDWNKALEEIHEYILQGIEMMMTDR